VPDTYISLPASNRAILTDRSEAGLFDEDHVCKSCRLVWSGLPLLTAAFVLVLAMCGCGSGVSTPIPGALSLTPGTLQFGDILVGVEANTNVDIANHGSETVVLSQIEIAGQTFSVAGGGSLPVSIPSGGTHTLSVGFAPVSAGNYSGALSLIDASARVVAQAAIYGRGSVGAPQLSVSAASLSFGDIAVNGAVQETLTLNSIGTQPVTVNSAATSVASFSVKGASFPMTLNPGQSVTLVVQFQPAAVGTANGQLSISSNSSTGATTVVALSGMGIAAANSQLTASTSSLSFGSVTVGTSVPQSLTLRSAGTSPVTVNSAAISGAGFRIAGGSFPVTLNPGRSVTLMVQFQPTTVAAASGQLSISSNSSTGATTVVALSGMGIAAANPQLSVSTNSLSFGSITVGTSLPQSLTLRSTGTSPVTVNSAAISGAGFTIAGGSFPVTLNPGRSMTLVVQFQPTTVAAASGQLSIRSNSSTGAITVVALSGTGIAAANPQLSASTSSLSFGSVTVGTSVPQPVTLRSTGASPVTVNSAAISGAGFTIVGGSFPMTLNPGRSMTLVVQFQPTTVAVAVGQLSISSDSSAGATTVVTLSGTGKAADPELTASATSVNFGSVAVNTATTSNLTLNSTGTTSVTVSSAQVQGAGFTIVGGSFPVTLNPGEALSLLIRFQPTVAGAATGQLTITSNSLGGSVVVPLSGLATAIAHEVDLSWLAPASSPDPVVGYNIYRSVSGGGFVQLNSVVSLPTTYVDSTVVSSVSYGYVAKSVDANGVESIASNEYQVTIP
jgi:hypothetical protein